MDSGLGLPKRSSILVVGCVKLRHSVSLEMNNDFQAKKHDNASHH